MEVDQLYDFDSWCVRIEPFKGESISHFLGRFERANEWTGYQIGKVAGIGAVLSRWKKLYLNPFPTQKEIEALAKLVEVDANRLVEMFPSNGKTLQPRPVKLCGACYDEAPCHLIEWQYKSDTQLTVCDRHQLRLLSKCPKCKKAFPIPALWVGRCCDNCFLSYSKMAKFQRLADSKHEGN